MNRFCIKKYPQFKRKNYEIAPIGKRQKYPQRGVATATPSKREEGWLCGHPLQKKPDFYQLFTYLHLHAWFGSNLLCLSYKFGVKHNRSFISVSLYGL
jgi:hypothetical protein